MNRMRVPKSNSGHSINSLPAYTSLFDPCQQTNANSNIDPLAAYFIQQNDELKATIRELEFKNNDLEKQVNDLKDELTAVIKDKKVEQASLEAMINIVKKKKDEKIKEIETDAKLLAQENANLKISSDLAIEKWKSECYKVKQENERLNQKIMFYVNQNKNVD